MTPETWKRIKRIVSDALERPASDRAAFVEAQCAGDASLLAEATALVNATDDAAALFESPIGGTTATSLAVLGAGRPVGPGDVVGAYRVVRELGRGGMGTVYLADRADGEFEQQVAIKFVAGIASAELVRKFREERRILATLQHPNVARLLDGGTTPDGHPYVIMEYVAGTPIDAYCSARGLTTIQRIMLFQQVCAAVQYAHQHLVIHRDIKAGNILVTGDGVPKLLDFGIATFIQVSAGRRVTTLRALTPESASPEQLSGGVITIASDVYSLGGLLYRLLTERSPYGDAASETALLRAISAEPPAPPGIDRDIDLILVKALRKEPERRYVTVEQLADDLSRYLTGRPVHAAPDTRRYRAAKFVRRHRASVAAAVAALLAIVIGSGAAVYQAGVARRERSRAEQRLADVRRLANSFVFEFHDAIADLPGSLKARQLVVKRAAEYLDNLAREGEGDVELQRELAVAYQRLGDIIGGPGGSNLGDWKGALARYQTAFDIRERLAADGMGDTAEVEGRSEIRVKLSRVYTASGDLERAEASAQDAAAVIESHVTDATGGSLAGVLATAYQQRAFVQTMRGRNSDALGTLERAMTHGQRSVTARPGDEREITRLARIQADFAQQLLSANRAPEAIPMLASARRNLESLVASDPLNARYRQTLLFVQSAQGQALYAAKDMPGAVAAFADAVATADALFDSSPDDDGMRFASAAAHHALGDALLRTGDAATALPHLRRSVADQMALVKGAPGHDYYRVMLVTAALDLGAALYRAPKIDPGWCAEVAPGLAEWESLAARKRLPGHLGQYAGRYKALRAACPAQK